MSDWYVELHGEYDYENKRLCVKTEDDTLVAIIRLDSVSGLRVYMFEDCMPGCRDVHKIQAVAQIYKKGKYSVKRRLFKDEKRGE